MKQISTFTTKLVLALAAVLMLGSCELAGLEFQKNEGIKTHILDNKINMTAWDFLKQRSFGKTPNDTIFNQMMRAIRYSGMDTLEYTKPGRTFIFLHWDAITNQTNSNPGTDRYFGRYLVPNGPGATRKARKWSEYPKEQVRNFLKLLIAEPRFSHDNLTIENDTLRTLMGPGVDPLNPEGILTIKIGNNADSRVLINDFPTTVRTVTARTSGIEATNGSIHVVDRLVEFRKPQ
jgi:hypothetical protein